MDPWVPVGLIGGMRQTERAIDFLAGYTTAPCLTCGVAMTRLEPVTAPAVCPACEAREDIAQLDPVQLQYIRTTIKEQGHISGLTAINDLTSLPLKKVLAIFDVLLRELHDQERIGRLRPGPTTFTEI